MWEYITFFTNSNEKINKNSDVGWDWIKVVVPTQEKFPCTLHDMQYIEDSIHQSRQKWCQHEKESLYKSIYVPT